MLGACNILKATGVAIMRLELKEEGKAGEGDLGADAMDWEACEVQEILLLPEEN